jgi:uncharacterized protein
MALVLLLLAFAAGLLLIPFGLPGLWLMAAAVGLYAWLGPTGALGPWTLGIVLAIAIGAELAEYIVTARATRRSGGSARSAWWALAGSFAGAILGVPVELVGSLIGAFLGAFVGAFLAELSLGRALDAASRAASGAIWGRVLAVGIKVASGVMIVVWVVGVIIWGSSFR